MQRWKWAWQDGAGQAGVAELLLATQQSVPAAQLVCLALVVRDARRAVGLMVEHTSSQSASMATDGFVLHSRLAMPPTCLNAPR